MGNCHGSFRSKTSVKMEETEIILKKIVFDAKEQNYFEKTS